MIKAYFDGSCSPINPGGKARYGIVVFRDEKKIFQDSGEIPNDFKGIRNTSNNVAEYAALLALLEYFIEKGFTQERILVLGDSRKVIDKCSSRNYSFSPKNKSLYIPVAICCLELLKEFSNISFRWISRKFNEFADSLASGKVKLEGQNVIILPPYKQNLYGGKRKKVYHLIYDRNGKTKYH